MKAQPQGKCSTTTKNPRHTEVWPQSDPGHFPGVTSYTICMSVLLANLLGVYKMPPLLYLNNHATSFSSYRSYNSLQPSSCNILPHVIRTQLPSWSSKQQLAFEKEDERLWGFPVAQAVKNLPAMQAPGSGPRVGKIPWRREWEPTPVLLPRESHGQRSLAGYSP